jgi:hypothetical protein
MGQRLFMKERFGISCELNNVSHYRSGICATSMGMFCLVTTQGGHERPNQEAKSNDDDEHR